MFIAKGYPKGDVQRYVSNLHSVLTMPPKVFEDHVAQYESLSITWLPKQQTWYTGEAAISADDTMAQGDLEGGAGEGRRWK